MLVLDGNDHSNNFFGSQPWTTDLGFHKVRGLFEFAVIHGIKFISDLTPERHHQEIEIPSTGIIISVQKT